MKVAIPNAESMIEDLDPGGVVEIHVSQYMYCLSLVKVRGTVEGDLCDDEPPDRPHNMIV